MDRPLVVTDSSDAVVDVIREAGELAEAADALLVVLTVVTEEEYDNDAAVLRTIADAEGSTINLEPAEYAKDVAQTAVDDILSDLELETTTVGRFVEAEDDRADAILDVAEENGCDYVFLLGRRRSPTGKAIFGDTAQSIILNFDDYVVTTIE